MKILAAAHVLPISQPPIERGAVAIAGEAIAGVGTLNDIELRFPDGDVLDLGNAAILPGFVNCHTHLEITAMRGALDSVEHDFTSWLLKLTALRSEMSDDEIEAAALLGAREAAAAGVTCLGDIGRMGTAGLGAMKTVGLRGVVFQETDFSADDRTAHDAFKALMAKFEDLKLHETDLVKVGLSPHAPYTVSSKLFEMLAQYSIIERVPLSIHAAESAAEHELLTQGTGFFTSVYEKFNVEWNSPRCTSIEYLERLGVLSARPLLAHCVTATDTDLARIASNGAAIAHCPKSNAKFGHGFAPFESMLNAGIAVGLGSDSVASNNVCDMLEEGRFASLIARNRPGSKRFIEPHEILEAATLGGARALGLDHLIGSLDEGKQADIAVVSLNGASQQPLNDVEAALVFSSSGANVIKTFVAGREIWDSQN